MRKLVIATANKGKVAEIRKLLKNHRFNLISLENFDVVEVAETGQTFRENSELKAAGYALQTGHWTLADDSGLEVAALGNKPGVQSARYAGPGATDFDNVQKLLTAMAQLTEEQRLARFVCAMSVSNPSGKIVLNSEGACDGGISNAPRGGNGFGYDPVFIPKGYQETFGELPDRVKQRLSHRSIALRKIAKLLTGIHDS